MERWKLRMIYFFLCFSFVHENFELCDSLNVEGGALMRFREGIEVDPYGALWNWVEESLSPCFWFGVECSHDGRVVALNLKNLGLKGILVPDLGRLIHMRTLNLHSNSFYGIIPKDIGDLKKLEVLDLGDNNLSGPLPSELGCIVSLELLSLQGNRFSDDIPPELYELIRRFEIKADENLMLATRGSVTRKVGNATIRRLLITYPEKKNDTHVNSSSSSPASDKAPDPRHVEEPASSRSPPPSPSSVTVSPPSPSSVTVPTPTLQPQSSTDHKKKWIIYMPVGALCFLVALSAGYLLCIRATKVDRVLPWATGLSGQLQKAFVTGVPSLGRVELQSACEDFSNVIGSLSDVTLYKGTLSTGVEIAVASTLSASMTEWSVQSEAQFRKKISVLSKVNHKNFMNLLGYCEEKEPFTRMMVFEYAPNGTLFEHLHIQEAEQLDWAARLRIIMGTIYCLEHMHQLDPPVVLRNLSSSSIYLTEDYAAKISDIGFWTEEKKTGMDPESSDQESIVYKFGILLLEIISGRLPFSADDGLLVLWASSYLTGNKSLNEMVDPTLSIPEDDISALCEVIQSCINPETAERPTVAEIASRMRLITSIAPDRAIPRLSPLWWAELEIMSSEAT